MHPRCCSLDYCSGTLVYNQKFHYTLLYWSTCIKNLPQMASRLAIVFSRPYPPASTLFASFLKRSFCLGSRLLVLCGIWHAKAPTPALLGWYREVYQKCGPLLWKTIGWAAYRLINSKRMVGWKLSKTWWPDGRTVFRWVVQSHWDAFNVVEQAADRELDSFN